MFDLLSREAPFKPPEWEFITFSLAEAPNEKHNFWYRDLHKVADWIFSNPKFEEQMDYAPKQIYTRDGKTRIYHEMSTGDDWKTAQVSTSKCPSIRTHTVLIPELGGGRCTEGGYHSGRYACNRCCSNDKPCRRRGFPQRTVVDGQHFQRRPGVPGFTCVETRRLHPEVQLVEDELREHKRTGAYDWSSKPSAISRLLQNPRGPFEKPQATIGSGRRWVEATRHNRLDCMALRYGRAVAHTRLGDVSLPFLSGLIPRPRQA